ncbi:hypothetical protein NK213_20030, partial [Sebaldella sp. S0638]|nr:hypothetical protein [Sebaldella sp. S0638]
MEQDRIETVLSVVDNYTREIERYRNELNTVTRQINNMGNTSGGATSGVQKLVASLGGIKGILAGLGIAVGIKEIGKLGLSCIDAASEIKELDNVLVQVFERGSREVVKWADSMSTNVGRASFELQQQAAIFGSIFKASGIKTEDLQDMSMVLSQLAADFSSFYDNDMSEVFTALKSGISGESEPLKRYGIILNETTAAEYALSQGIKTKWREMSEAQKQIIRYNFLMDKTKFIQGDAERTIDSYANQIKVLDAYWDNISRTLGQKFIPAGEGVLHTINGMMGALDAWLTKPDLNNYIRSFEEEKKVLEDLAIEFEKLSKAPETDISSQQRLSAILDELNSKYPGILENIKKENGAYVGVREAIEGIISSLNEKINMQILEEFSEGIIELKKKATKEIDDLRAKINKNEINIKVKYKNADIDKLTSDDFIQTFRDNKREAERAVMAMSREVSSYYDDQKMFYNEVMFLIEQKAKLPEESAKIVSKYTEKMNSEIEKAKSFQESFKLATNTEAFKEIDGKIDSLMKKDELTNSLTNVHAKVS